MFAALSILGSILIGWLVPAAVMARAPSTMGAVIGCVAALALGAGFIWLGSHAVGALGLEDQYEAWQRGFNSWKIMLLIAPASALAARRKLNAKED